MRLPKTTHRRYSKFKHRQWCLGRLLNENICSTKEITNKVQSTPYKHYLYPNRMQNELKKLSTKPRVPSENRLQVWASLSKDISILIKNPENVQYLMETDSNHMILSHPGQTLTSVIEMEQMSGEKLKW